MTAYTLDLSETEVEILTGTSCKGLTVDQAVDRAVYVYNILAEAAGYLVPATPAPTSAPAEPSTDEEGPRCDPARPAGEDVAKASEPRATCKALIKEYLADGAWRTTAQVAKAIGLEEGARGQERASNILGKMARKGEVERYPQVTPGRHARGIRVEWRLAKEGGA